MENIEGGTNPDSAAGASTQPNQELTERLQLKRPWADSESEKQDDMVNIKEGMDQMDIDPKTSGTDSENYVLEKQQGEMPDIFGGGDGGWVLTLERLSSFSSSPSHPIPSHPIPAHPIPSHPIPSHPIPAHPIPSHPIPSQPIPSHPIPSHPIPSQPIPSHPIPSHPSPSHPIPSALS
ncbi:hypothetical protein L249_4508 [Ophiocordyceps polyrhachis-furcata BCC 54312]|uniref:Uncharacterized protein n=1 Tax=Ophiocordyceps polyrhachis-furcata BCC 54312 TaxID=1330021 RepID=A0A367KYZ8_9HYPO|nr:hypothetical protein L249_4508 [Ophiocordyceps polyrhachis-furcata BCC 54312]